jgi:hypothetical protein
MSYEERTHIPEERPGCYYERVESACLVCRGRFVLAAIRRSRSEGQG